MSVELWIALSASQSQADGRVLHLQSQAQVSAQATNQVDFASGEPGLGKNS